MTEPQTTTTPATGEIVARAASYYRMTRYVIVAMLIGWGAWSIRDGFFKYPQHRARAEELRAKRADLEKSGAPATEVAAIGAELTKLDVQSDTNIMLNQAFGVLFPPLGIFMLLYSLHNSRGEIRLKDDVLYAPGHPAVPLDNLTELDRKLWDRKGIAHVKYEVAGSPPGSIRLDDFIYERKPIDQIYDRIQAKFEPPSAQAPPATD